MVLKRYPDYSQGWYDLSLIYSSIGKKANAYYCLEKAMKFEPENGLYILTKARFEEEKGNYFLAKRNALNILKKRKFRYSSPSFGFCGITVVQAFKLCRSFKIYQYGHKKREKSRFL